MNGNEVLPVIPFQLSTGLGLYIVTIPGVGQLPAENH